MKNVFIIQGLLPAERIIGLQDRDSSSPTYGCFDRNYWNYKITDYPSGWFAAGAYYLALLAKTPGTPFFKNPRIEEWSWAGVLFAEKSLNTDGSIAEVYPFERSFCATAFLANYVTNAAKLLGEQLPKKFIKTLDWLCHNDNPQVSNQRAAAIAAIAQLSDHFGQKRKNCIDKLSGELLQKQDYSGFFPEYGGPDLGYQTITLSMLSHVMEYDERFPECVLKGIEWVINNTDEKAGFDYCSFTRKTQFIYPFAFAKNKINKMMERILDGINVDNVLLPNWMDDRYVIEYAIDYLEAGMVLLDADESC